MNVLGEPVVRFRLLQRRMLSGLLAATLATAPFAPRAVVHAHPSGAHVHTHHPKPPATHAENDRQGSEHARHHGHHHCPPTHQAHSDGHSQEHRHAEPLVHQDVAATPGAHVHWQFFGWMFDWAPASSSNPPARHSADDPFAPLARIDRSPSAGEATMAELAMKLRTNSNSSPAPNCFLPNVSQPGHEVSWSATSRFSAAIPLCDAARNQRTGVLLI